MSISVVLGSRVNVRMLMEMLEIIEETLFEALHNGWRKRTARATEYHPGRTGSGGDFRVLRPLVAP